MRRFSPPDLVFNFKYSVFPNEKAVSIFLILQSIAVPFRESAYLDYISFSGWLTASLVSAFLVIFALFLLKDQFARKYGDKVPVLNIFALGAFLGMAKGASTEYLANLLYTKDSYPWDEIAIRAYSGAFLGMGIAFVVSLASTYSKNVAKQREELSRKNDEIAREISLVGEEIESLKRISKEEIIERIQKDLQPMLKDEIFNLDPEKNWRRISESLRSGIAQKVRQESHDIKGLNRQKISLRHQIVDVLTFRVLNLHPRVFALIQFSIGATVVYQDWNPRNSILNLIAHTFITLSVTSFCRRWLLRRDDRNTTRNFVAFFGVIFFHSLFYSLTDLFLWNHYSIIFHLSTTIWQVFLLFLISLISELIQVQNEQRDLEFEMNLDLTDKKRILDQQFLILSEEMSKHLHGFLMNKIYSTATKLDGYADLQDFAGFRKEMDGLLNEFSFDSLLAGFKQVEVSPEFFQEVQNHWDGLIQVVFDCEESVFSHFLSTQRVEMAQVVEELIVNAYRHGAASLIHIAFSEIKPLGPIRITAKDNGSGLKQKIHAGLGTQLFDSAADGNWVSKNEKGSGAFFELIISPYEPEAEVPFISSRE